MIGENLRKYRKMSKLTQKELASRADVSTGYIQMIELGKKENPSMKLLNKMASVLGVSVTDLIDPEDEKKILIHEILSIENDIELIKNKKVLIFSEIEKRYDLLNLVGGIEALKRIDSLRFKIEYRSDKGFNTDIPASDSFDTHLKKIEEIEKDVFE